MANPLPLPVRVLVKGPSTVNWISWMGGPRSDFSYPRVIEDDLLAHGRPATVRNTGVLGEPVRAWFPAWERDVLQFSPDVVVLSAGHYEAVHLFLPHWFERHANLVATRGGAASRLYRKLVLRPFWKFVVTAQGKLDTVLPTRVRRRRIQRAVADTEAFIRHARQVGGPLVLVLEVLLPAPAQSRWFPGMAGRVELANALLREAVEGFGDSDVRWVATGEIAQKHYGEDLQMATPDGFHFTPELHRAVGEELAREIREWTDGQAHLQPERRPGWWAGTA